MEVQQTWLNGDVLYSVHWCVFSTPWSPYLQVQSALLCWRVEPSCCRRGSERERERRRGAAYITIWRLLLGQGVMLHTFATLARFE